MRKILIHESKESLGQRLCNVCIRGGSRCERIAKITADNTKKDGSERSISQITHRDLTCAWMHTAKEHNVWFHEALARLLALHEFVFEPSVLVVANDGRRPIVGLGLGA